MDSARDPGVRQAYGWQPWQLIEGIPVRQVLTGRWRLIVVEIRVHRALGRFRS